MGGISSSLSSLASMTMSGDDDDDLDDDFALPGDNGYNENDEWDTDAMSGMMFSAPEPQPEQATLIKRGSVRRMSARFSAAAVPEPEHHDASLPSAGKTRRSSMRRSETSAVSAGSSEKFGFGSTSEHTTLESTQAPTTSEEFGFGSSEKFGFDT